MLLLLAIRALQVPSSITLEPIAILVHGKRGEQQV